jgi:RNA polymerase sigma-70 factor, ECF subfamily
MPSRVSPVSVWAVPSGIGDEPASALAPAPLETSSSPSPEAALPPAWLRDHAGTLWRIVARLGVPKQHIEDVLQETFITATRRRAEIREGRERAFLIGTATRVCANYRRRAHVRHEVGEQLDEHPSQEPDAERLLMRKRLRQRLDVALAALSEAHRSVFVLYELEGLSVPEIAELSGLPPNTVASRLGRARAKFAEAAARLERADGPLEEP